MARKGNKVNWCGKVKDYCRLFDHTVAGLKAVLPQAGIGALATNNRDSPLLKHASIPASVEDVELATTGGGFSFNFTVAAHSIQLVQLTPD